MPSQGSISSPVARPARPSRVPGVNKFKAPNFRPERPVGNFPQFQTDFNLERQQPTVDSTSPLSTEVVLPPINPNNPNFQILITDPNGYTLPGGTPNYGNYNPYFPPNYSGSFPNQYPYPPYQPSSSSTSTSTSTSSGGGNGGSAAAASAAGNSSKWNLK